MNQLDKKDLEDIFLNTDSTNKKILLRLYERYEIINNILKKHLQVENEENIKRILSTYEKETYKTNDKILNDEEIIEFEIDRIQKELKNQQTSKVEENENKRHLLVLVDYYLDKLLSYKNVVEIKKQEDIDFMKKTIAYIEILLDMKNGLYYETYKCFFEEFERLKGKTKLKK